MRRWVFNILAAGSAVIWLVVVTAWVGSIWKSGYVNVERTTPDLRSYHAGIAGGRINFCVLGAEGEIVKQFYIIHKEWQWSHHIQDATKDVRDWEYGIQYTKAPKISSYSDAIVTGAEHKFLGLNVDYINTTDMGTTPYTAHRQIIVLPAPGSR